MSYFPLVHPSLGSLLSSIPVRVWLSKQLLRELETCLTTCDVMRGFRLLAVLSVVAFAIQNVTEWLRLSRKLIPLND